MDVHTTKSIPLVFANVPFQTNWSLLGLGVEVGLVPNIMKGINIFTAHVIKKTLLRRCLKYATWRPENLDCVLSPKAYLH
jgi:hypothetical protein